MHSTTISIPIHQPLFVSAVCVSGSRDCTQDAGGQTFSLANEAPHLRHSAAKLALGAINSGLEVAE